MVTPAVDRPPTEGASLRIQELGALAGHDLSSVVTSIAEQAGSMLETAGAACWAFSEDGQVADGELREGLRDALQTVVTGVLDRVAAA